MFDLPDVFVISGWGTDGHDTVVLGFTGPTGAWNKTRVVSGDPDDEYRRARTRINRAKGRPTT